MGLVYIYRHLPQNSQKCRYNKYTSPIDGMGLLAEKFQFQVVLLKLPRTFDSARKQKIHCRD